MIARRSLSVLVFLSLLLGSQAVVPAHAFVGTVRYAAPGGATTGSCTSWGTACELQYAISVASSGDEIWAKMGTYRPTTGSDRTASFNLKNGVAIYGGFTGTETLLSQRNFSTHTTYLSGEIGDPALPVDNSYHVVTGSGTDASAVLDGFFVIAGNANNPNNLSTQDVGGGMYNNSGSPTVSNVLFESNTALTGGGAIWNQASSPTLTDLYFVNNKATDGGAIYDAGVSSPTVTDTVFDTNSASGNAGGGAMFNDGGSNAQVSRVTFKFNFASAGPGGAMVNQDGSSPQVTNVTFFQNSATHGGAVYTTFGSPSFLNVTMNGNSTSGSGGAMFDDQSAAVTIDDSIFWGDGADEIATNAGGTATVHDSVVQGGCPSSGATCGNIIATDPLLGGLLISGGVTPTLALGAGSSALDAGNDTTCAMTDQREVNRPQGPHCDMGAYEHVYAPVLYASGGGLSTGFCDSWVKSCQLTYALGLAVSGEQIWVKAGLPYVPTTGSDRSASFNLKNGVALYGGFAGTETLLSQRDPEAHPTDLDGNIGSLISASDNSYHVVTAIGVDNTAVLDGFYITNGQADGGSADNNGGGTYNTGNPVLRNLVFGGNHAAAFGGGLYNNGAGGDVSNTTFAQNSAGLGGGGMFNNSNGPEMFNLTFNANSAGSYGGAMENDYSTPVLVNATFSGNLAGSGGSGGGVMDNVGSSVIMLDSLLWDNGTAFVNISGSTLTVNDSLVQGGCPTGATCNTNIINSDPLLGPLQDNGGPTRTMALLSDSPAIDAGNLSSCAATDQRGLSRQGASCDMGAFEYVTVTIAGNAGVAGATLNYVDGTAKQVVTDGSGNYSLPVAYWWSGSVTPTDGTYVFTPDHRPYIKVTANQTGQDYTVAGGAGKYDDTDPLWTYAGGWATVTTAGPYDNTLHVASTVGSSGAFTFSGNQFSLTYLTYPGWGQIGVYVDGSSTPLTTLNTNAAAGLPTYTSPLLWPGTHTVVIKHAGPSGTMIAIDAIAITAPTYSPAGTFDDADAAWNYAGAWGTASVAAAYDTTLHIAVTTGSTATFYFAGGGFQLTYLNYPGWGTIGVYLDGSLLATLNTNAPAALPTYFSPAMTSGAHTLVVRNNGPSGTYIAIDKLVTTP